MKRCCFCLSDCKMFEWEKYCREDEKKPWWLCLLLVLRSQAHKFSGSLSSAIFLVAGTTIGVGILAIPAVTTGLLIAEVNVNTMCELGSGGVSLVSMAKRTLGVAGVQFSCWSYIFIHYALLIAYVARSSDILTNFLGIPLWESATLFSLVFGGICYFGSQRFIGAVNGVLVFGIIISFTSLVVAASGDLHLDALLKANFSAVPMSIPIIALSFVYQNVVPVLCTNLEGNLSKVRTAIVLGTAIPLGLFLVWDGVILGSISTPEMADKIADPLQQLLSTNGVVGALDFAGTYGVLVLFGIIPAAMAWSDRYSSSSTSIKLQQLVPGGKVTLSLVMGAAGFIILSEILENFMHL
ncbi:hypothetical protein D5086_002021 [Populus alba]|uniref:Uncharacterized protein n=1 Tax=Populus alba TaxID=43335 RepID=A0ACC4D2M5_POPAL